MDQGNTAFVLITAALVLLMTPGLAFFYGGLVKAKSVISMMMMSFGAIGLIGVLWVIYGYAISFANNTGIDGFFGIDFSNLFLDAAWKSTAANEVAWEGVGFPALAFAAFQATFAIITVALISGAIADRAKFGSWLIFAGIWATVVYFPVASWVFNFSLDYETLLFTDGGWLTYGLQEAWGTGLVDFAGGTAVHINAGAAALALALVLGKRVGFGKGVSVPHNPPFVLLGAGLLWFGWFGFNAGSELGADGTAASPLSTRWLLPPRHCSVGSSLRSSKTGRRPRSERLPALSQVSSRSRRPVQRFRRCGQSCLALSPERSAPSRSTSSSSSASMTLSTWSASTSSAVWSERCTLASLLTALASSTAAASCSWACRPLRHLRS